MVQFGKKESWNNYFENPIDRKTVPYFFWESQLIRYALLFHIIYLYWMGTYIEQRDGSVNRRVQFFSFFMYRNNICNFFLLIFLLVCCWSQQLWFNTINQRFYVCWSCWVKKDSFISNLAKIMLKRLFSFNNLFIQFSSNTCKKSIKMICNKFSIC